MQKIIKTEIPHAWQDMTKENWIRSNEGEKKDEKIEGMNL